MEALPDFDKILPETLFRKLDPAFSELSVNPKLFRKPPMFWVILPSSNERWTLEKFDHWQRRKI
jgi:hypothetical protein